MTFIDFIVELVILVVLVVIIVGGIFSGITESLIKKKCYDLYMKCRYFGGICWGIPDCGDDNCRLRRYCYLRRYMVTEETIEELEHMLEERRKELEQGDSK